MQVWYDNRADDLTKEGMLKGIEQAAAFILVSRPPHYICPGQFIYISSLCSLLLHLEP